MTKAFRGAAVARRFSQQPTDFVYADLRDTLLRSFGDRGAISTRRLGNWLVSREGRIVGGHKFARFGSAHGGLTKWGVRAVER